MDRSTAPLTPAMTEAIKATGPEDVMAGGSTRTGLINRGMVHPKGSDRFGKLTESGLQARTNLLPAPAAEVAPEAEAAYVTILEDALTPAQAETVAAGVPVVLTDEAEVDNLLAHLGVITKPAPAAPGLGSVLRPVLEAGVRMARTIPDGRRRHGQTKARRDALRHARKLELAGI